MGLLRGPFYSSGRGFTTPFSVVTGQTGRVLLEVSARGVTHLPFRSPTRLSLTVWVSVRQASVYGSLQFNITRLRTSSAPA